MKIKIKVFLLSAAIYVLADTSLEDIKDDTYYEFYDYPEESEFESYSSEADIADYKYRRDTLIANPTEEEDKKKYKDKLFEELQFEKKYRPKDHDKYKDYKDDYKYNKEKYKSAREKYKYYKKKYTHYKDKVNYYRYHSDKKRDRDYDYWSAYEDYKYYKEKYKHYKERMEKYYEKYNDYRDKYKDHYYSDSYSYDYSSESTYLDLKGNMRQKLAFVAMQGNGYSVVCSPLSAMVPVAILVFGAEGKTLKEMLKAIGLGSRSSVHSHFKSLIREMNSLSGIHMASRVYIDYKYKLRSSFKDEATKTFGSCIEQIDMKDPRKVASEISKWVKYHTNNRLDVLLTPGDIGHHTHMIIVDTVYFYGKWKHRFETAYHEGFQGRGGTRTVTMMYTTHKFYYGKSEKLGAQILEVPYKDRDAKLLLVLPFSTNGLSSLISQMKLTPDHINSVHMSEKLVSLRLPKFRIENELDLGALYRRVGLDRMFSSSSGLRDVVKDQTLIVDKAIQKIHLIIEDEATVAAGGLGAAAPGLGTYTTGKGIEFYCNHPFMFFIISNKQQLFAGVLN